MRSQTTQLAKQIMDTIIVFMTLDEHCKFAKSINNRCELLQVSTLYTNTQICSFPNYKLRRNMWCTTRSTNHQVKLFLMDVYYIKHNKTITTH